MRTNFALLMCLCALGPVWSAQATQPHVSPPARSPVSVLPGLKAAVPFKQFTGYIEVDATAGRRLFYWFVESMNDPAKDPVVLWLTGGPGCSSMFALLTEHGPFYVDHATSNATHPVLELRQYPWNGRANMLYVDAPCGVGFSYADDGNYTTGDDSAAEDNAAFLAGWFKAFPEFAQHELFIAGESYAGHYVPQLVSRLLSTPLKAQLRGFTAGNPSFNFTNDVGYFFPFVSMHALLDHAQYEEALRICGGAWWPPSPACANATAALRQYLVGVNPYDIYAPCLAPPDPKGGCLTNDAWSFLLDAVDSAVAVGRAMSSEELAAVATAAEAHARMPAWQRAAAAAARANGAAVGMGVSAEAGAPGVGAPASQTFVPCVDVTPERDYMNRPDVRAALNVVPASFAWDVCSSHINYTQYGNDVPGIYAAVTGTTDLRVLVYSGDVDTCVPYPGTEINVDMIGHPVSAPWRQWHVQGQIAGYTRTYAVPQQGGSLVYATIKGAGHMAATYKPAQAQALFHSFINGTF